MQLTALPCPPLTGRARIPGDKSMSHRALMLGAVAKGETIIGGLLESADIRATAAALRALGVKLGRLESGLWQIQGSGPQGLRSPAQILDMGNSGTGARLLAGLLTGTDVTATFAGDKSLSRRPMKRILAPLAQMGATILARDDDFMPFTLRGAGAAVKPLRYEMVVPSAQVKSALLLAGLFADGQMIIDEKQATRDHTEIMLAHFGAAIRKEETRIILEGGAPLAGCGLEIPGDPSAAAFIVAAALLGEGAAVTLPGIGVNPTRSGFYEILRAMGADISFNAQPAMNGEAVATIIVRGGKDLNAVEVSPAQIPALIDEIPILAVVAAFARGRTILRGLAELRVKESDRVEFMARGLAACGVRVEIEGDDLIIIGDGQPPPGGALIETAQDHRIAMSFLILGGASKEGVTIDDDHFIDTSFPDFAALMNGLGARIAPPDSPVFADPFS